MRNEKYAQNRAKDRLVHLSYEEGARATRILNVADRRSRGSAAKSFAWLINWCKEAEAYLNTRGYSASAVNFTAVPSLALLVGLRQFSKGEMDPNVCVYAYLRSI